MPIANNSTPASVARSGLSATAGRHVDANRAGHARAAKTAIAIGVLRQVLLVIILGEIELRRRDDLGRDPAVAGLAERALELIARALRVLTLPVVEIIDARA